MPLVAAHSKPLGADKLAQQLGRLGNTPFRLESLNNAIQGEVMLPVSELNRLRRDLVARLEDQRSRPQRWQFRTDFVLPNLMPPVSEPGREVTPELIALVRNRDQLEAAIATDIATIYCEFENPATYKDTVTWFRHHRHHNYQTLWVAPPRIAVEE